MPFLDGGGAGSTFEPEYSGINKVELIMRRRLVREFIKADRVNLVITRKTTPTKNPRTGGMLAGSTQTLDSQLARIVQNKRRYNNGIVNSEAGDIPHTDYLLLGMHTLDVEVEDTFIWLGVHYHITGIHEARTESTLCSIDLLGKTNHA